MGQLPRQPPVQVLTGGVVLVAAVSVLKTYKLSPCAVPISWPSVVDCSVNVSLAPPTPPVPPLGTVPPSPAEPPLVAPASEPSAAPPAPASLGPAPPCPASSFVAPATTAVPACPALPEWPPAPALPALPAVAGGYEVVSLSLHASTVTRPNTAARSNQCPLDMSASSRKNGLVAMIDDGHPFLLLCEGKEWLLAASESRTSAAHAEPSISPCPTRTRVAWLGTQPEQRASHEITNPLSHDHSIRECRQFVSAAKRWNRFHHSARVHRLVSA